MRATVKRESEIRATLDENDSLEGLPFTAEMWALCGRTFDVRAHANRIFVEGFQVRSIRNAVLLQGARCNGESHNRCGRLCLFLFKKAWLTLESERFPRGGPEEKGEAFERVAPLAVRPLLPCQGQAPVLLRATQPPSMWAPWSYVGDVPSGRMSSRDFLCMSLFSLNRRWDVREDIWQLRPETMTWLRLIQTLRLLSIQRLGPASRRPKIFTSCSALAEEKAVNGHILRTLELEPGEVVEVRDPNEILATLDSKGRNRGLSFVGSMLKYCGGRYRVLARPTCVVDEKSGTLRATQDIVLLEGVTCDGISYRGCPRQCYWFWRESWVKRI